MIKKLIHLSLIILIGLNIYFFSFSVLKGEIYFFNDVARDFLLLKELDNKKIMLIGPRSNASGLFHGPLWSYLNYPVYLISEGNPVIVGWFWIFLSLISLTIGFYLANKTVGKTAGLVFIFTYSSNFLTHINGMFHSDAPVFWTPILFFSAFYYLKNKKWYALLCLFFTATMIMQLNVGVGIPIVFLSIIFSLIQIVFNRNWKHLLLFPLIGVFLSNFAVFDLRHEFLLTKSALAFAEFQKYWHPLSTSFFIKNRFESTIDLRVGQTGNFAFVFFIFLIVIFFTYKEIRYSQKLRSLYLTIIYFYFGYMLLSFFNKGVILSHFIYFLSPLTTFWFSTFFKKNRKYLLLPLLFFIVIINIRFAYNHKNSLERNFMDKNFESWRGLSKVALEVVSRQKDNPYGYYVFSPDAFAYGPRYAMIYNFKKTQSPAFEYQKKSTTYVIAAPPPPNDPYMTHDWWRKNPVKITKDPVWTKKFDNGYTIEEYFLDEKEQQVTHDKTIELGIHFR